MLTGEGSSRIFPAKNAIYENLKRGSGINISTEGSTQALEYELSGFSVFGASNSGETREVIKLMMALKESGHKRLFGLTANSNTTLEKVCRRTHILGCGREDAVAATKSVIEQALFYHHLVAALYGEKWGEADITARLVEEALTAEVDPAITDALATAGTIYFAGRNNGVAEELTLKTNEITRKRSDYLEGTYAVHGIEEIMDSNDVLVWINPCDDEVEKFRKCLVDGVGIRIVAISEKETVFPTLILPHGSHGNSYAELAAGWNLLVEAGIECGIDLDKPERARKIGNQF